jgi:cell division protein FtsL
VSTAAPAPRRSPRPVPRPQPRPASPTGRVAAPPAKVAPTREPTQSPDLQVVPRRASRVRLGAVGAIALVLLFGSMLGLAVFHSILVQGQLHLDQTNRQIEQEQARERELRLQVAQLAAPDRILAAAEQRGMVQPNDRKYLAAVVPSNVVPPPPTTKASR